MFGSKIAWGIDIGESAIRAAKLKVEKNGARVLALDVIPRSGRAEGYSYLDKEEQIRDALSTFVSRNKIGSARVALSVPGAGFDRFISLPAVNMKQVPQIVKYEARQQIPFPLEEVAWDYQLASDRLIPGEGVEVALFAIKTQIIEQVIANLSVARLGADIIGMSRLALYNFLKYDRQIDDGTVIIDVGAGSTDIVLLAEGGFRVRSIPISGEAVTKMLQQKFGISYEEAEELKVKASQSKQPEKLFNVMRPTFERLLGEIHKTIGYYKQQFKTLKVNQAFLLGESFKMQPLVDLFAENLGCKVDVLSRFERVSVAPEALSSPHSSSLPSFVVAMGLALQAAGEGPVTVNVLPEDVRLQREVQRKQPLAIGTAACFGAGVLAAFLNVSGTSNTLSSFSGQATYDKYNNLVKQYKEVSDTSAIETKISGLMELGENRNKMLEVVNTVSAIFGTDDKPGVPIEIFLNEMSLQEVQPQVKQEYVDPFANQGEAPPPPPKPELVLTLKGWSELETSDIYRELVGRLRQYDDIFSEVEEPSFKLEDETALKAEGESRKKRRLFSITAKVRTEQPVEQKEDGQ